MEERWAPDDAIDTANARLAARLAELEQMPIGASLVGALAGLRGAPTDCTGGVRLTALWDRVISWAQAESMICCADAVRGADLPAFVSGHDATQIVAQELATMTHVSFGTAMNRVALIGTVSRQLPASWEALDRGQLRLAHLDRLADETSNCPPRVAQAVDTHVIPLAITNGWTPTQLARAARNAVIALDPDGATDRATKAKSCADVRLYPDRDETASLVAVGDAVPLRAVMDAIDMRATELRRNGDRRPVGVRRLDALTSLILGETTRPAVEVVITTDLTTALGLTNHPGELSGYGPISADTARELTRDATLRRLITDPITGTMIDLGHRRYPPSAMLRRIIITRDRTCRFPGCERRATQCDCDHRTSWHLGGPTNTENLHPLCRMHHNLKTHNLWRVHLNTDSSQTWTSPLGYTYTTPAATYQHEHYEPLHVDDPPPDPYEHLITLTDPDPPLDDPNPTPPPITDDEYRAFTDTLDQHTYTYANTNYDTWWALGLVS